MVFGAGGIKGVLCGKEPLAVDQAWCYVPYGCMETVAKLGGSACYRRAVERIVMSSSMRTGHILWGIACATEAHHAGWLRKIPGLHNPGASIVLQRVASQLVPWQMWGSGPVWFGF